jgi:hypothetical protein
MDQKPGPLQNPMRILQEFSKGKYCGRSMGRFKKGISGELEGIKN